MTIKDYYPDRLLRDRMYADFGKDARRLCRDCPLFSRSTKTYTAGRCAFICTPPQFVWRGDWPACGMIDLALAVDEELKGSDGRRPVAAMVKRKVSAGLLVADNKIIGSVEDMDTQPVVIDKNL